MYESFLQKLKGRSVGKMALKTLTYLDKMLIYKLEVLKFTSFSMVGYIFKE